jgi:tetratricopeptide (TPR) repeat protein
VKSHGASGWLVALAAAGLLDVAVVAGLLAAGGDRARAMLLLGGHAVLAATAALLVVAAVRPPPGRDRLVLGLSTLPLALFVPAVGGIGLWLAFAGSATRGGARNREPWSRLHVDPAVERTPRRARRAANPVAIAAILADRGATQAGRRFEALLRTADMPPRVAVRLLKSALKDPSEEVRLFAFSRLERLRADLEHALEGFRRALDVADDDATRAHLRLRLAETNWEFAYLGLAEGAVLEHALDRAVENASESKRLAKNPTASFLLGRILLFRRETDAAAVELERASRLGYPMAKVLPYLAECAFEARSFGSVRSYLRQLERSTQGHAPLARVREFWR